MKNSWVILFLLLLPETLVAASPQTKNLEKKRKELQSEIDKNNQLIAENSQSIQLNLNRLNLVAQQIETRKILLSVLEEEINSINDEINLKESAVEKLEQNLQMKKEQYAVAVRQLYKQKNNSDQWLFVLSAGNFSQSFRRMLYLKEYSQWQRSQADEILMQQQKLNEEKTVLLAAINEKQSISELKRNEENQLLAEEKKHQTEVDHIRKNSKQLKAEIEKKKKQAAALDREIERIIRMEIEKSEKAAQKDTKIERKTESKGGFALTKDEQTLAANFGANRGKLPFPLKGNYRIVSRFGKHQSGINQTMIDNNGIDIQTSEGNTATVVFEGVVMTVFRVQGEQISVLVRHGSYITHYSNLMDVFVKNGDKVKTNQEIGRIYTDKLHGNATVLHFELWKEKTKLDPEPWLRK